MRLYLHNFIIFMRIIEINFFKGVSFVETLNHVIIA
jgi:hypothetical protein